MQNYQYILRENVVSDNTLTVPAKGYVFKGGYVAILKENTFLNAWQDKETVTRFRSKERVQKYLEKNYKEEFENLDFWGSVLE